MRKIKIILEYEGTQYCGWQYQPDRLSIQEVLEKCLEKITKVKTAVVGSGRTDSGVHAKGQVAHFLTESKMTEHQFQKALNSLLPHDIVVQQTKEVDMKFHSRKSATRKLYRYTILNRDYPSALNCRYSHYIASPLKISAMRQAAKEFLGKKDFASFQGAGCEAKSSVREIYKFTISKEENWIEINIIGSGFLKHMVRNLVGTLIEVGLGKCDAQSVRAILKARDRNKAGPTAPARGLCLVKVSYKKGKTKKKE